MGDVTVITGDFNEDFTCDDNSSACVCPFPDGPRGNYATLMRGDWLRFSRPANKQEEGQSSGKGKIDWIFVRPSQQYSLEFVRDPASKTAMEESHRPCAATGEWPSDHGVEAFSV